MTRKKDKVADITVDIDEDKGKVQQEIVMLQQQLANLDNERSQILTLIVRREGILEYLASKETLEAATKKGVGSNGK